MRMSLRQDGVIVADAKFNPVVPEGINCTSISSTDYGNCGRARYFLMKNMVASGASWALLGLPMEVFNKAVEEEFGRKGAAVVEKNIEAVRSGAEFVLD